MTCRNNHSLITAFAAFSCIALIVCGVFTLSGCTTNSDPLSDEVGTPRTPLTIRATASSFISSLHQGTPATRIPTEDDYQTVFASGDAIGVFAIRNIGTSAAAFADNINNLKLVCSVDVNTQKVTWAPEDASKILFNYDNLTYIAYYPYKAGISINLTSATSDDILKQLDAHKNLQPLKDQSKAADYTASDLMTAVASPTGTTNKQIDLQFEHRRSLLVLNLQTVTPCVASADAGFVYRKGAKVASTDPNAKDVILNNTTPCQMSDGSYRAIVVSTTKEQKISGSYASTNGAASATPSSILYSSDNSIAFAVGSYYSLNVVSPLSGVGSPKRALQPDDFVFHGTKEIEVYPGNGILNADGKIPDYNDAVGIVVTCKSDRISQNDKAKGWTHAYVMGLEDLPNRNVSWGPHEVQVSVLPEIPKTMAKDHMDGYSDTAIMLAHADLNSYPLFVELKKYRDSKPLPGAGTICSEWFIPSIGQWIDVLNYWGTTGDINNGWYERNALPMFKRANDQLKKVGRSLFPLDNPDLEATQFWTSSLKSGNFAWHIYAQHIDAQYDYALCWMSAFASAISLTANPTEAFTARPFFAF